MLLDGKKIYCFPDYCFTFILILNRIIDMKKKRMDHEPPSATNDYGWRYHHLGIPTTKVHSNETYLERYKMYVSGFDTSPFGIEWMRFEPDSPISELIQTVPHIAFEVDDLDSAIIDKELIGDITSPSKGTRVAMILDNGAPVELIEFKNC